MFFWNGRKSTACRYRARTLYVSVQCSNAREKDNPPSTFSVLYRAVKQILLNRLVTNETRARRWGMAKCTWKFLFHPTARRDLTASYHCGIILILMEDNIIVVTAHHDKLKLVHPKPTWICDAQEHCICVCAIMRRRQNLIKYSTLVITKYPYNT